MERFLNYFEPEKYVLDLKIDKHQKTIGGLVTVVGTSKNDRIKFHAVRLSITEVLVDNEKTEFSVSDDELVVSTEKGKHEIAIKYSGKLNENMQGAYLSTYEYDGKTEIIVATQFESHYAREAFPCIDEPGAKAVFELSLELPEESKDLVIANTPVKKYEGNKYVFEPTPRMSTYLLAWVIGRFHGKTVKNAHGVEITTYVALNQDIDSVDFANEIAAKSLEFYDDNFGTPYPLAKLDQVALPDFEAGAMENWGLVTYRESMLIAGKNATLGAKKGVALTVAHELSHQWFGDLVTMNWWDDLWLNESFASVMEYYAVDYIHPEYKIFEGFFTADALAALRRDAYLGVQSVHQDVNNPEEIATLFDPSIVYAKGARLMLMAIRAMGWDNFCAGIREYFDKFKYGNTVGDDLWKALTPHAGFDVHEMMHAFIDKPGYPVLEKTADGYKQRRFLLNGELEESDWPIPKVIEDMSGHYVLNLSDEEFNERLGRFDELKLEEKLRLLIDRDLISKTELASSSSLIPLVLKFKKENSAAVWNIILTIISNLKIFFEFESEEEKKFKKFIKELVQEKLSELGLKTREGDDENTLRLRSILLALDFYADDEENIQKLAAMYDTDFSKIDAEIRNDILDAKIYMEPTILDEYMDKYRSTADPEIKFDLLFATTLSRDKKNLERMMEYLRQPEVVKPQDMFHLFLYLYRNARVKKEVFNWMIENWDYIKKISGDKSLDDYPRYTAASVRTEEEYKKYRDFFEPMSDEPALARAIEIGKNEIEARLGLIKKDQEKVFRELD
ncbi:M1 family metallopeptidase [Candidatus Saccharibacteria bacterium]|nr:M1 family metallopeptidase [Candidatus Saccharibacteria bacterium]